MKRIGLVLVCALLCSTVGAAETSMEDMLATARAANQVYQRHLFLLRDDLKSDDIETRHQAMTHLARTGDAAVIQDLTPFLDKNAYPVETVAHAMLVLTNMGAIGIEPTLREYVNGKIPELREAAVGSLARLDVLGTGDYANLMDAAIDDKRTIGTAGAAAENKDQAGQRLQEILEADTKALNRRLAASALGRLGDPSYGKALANALTDSDPFVRRYAAESIVALNYREAVPDLLMAMQADSVTDHLNRALMRLTGEDFGFRPTAPRDERNKAIMAGFNWWSKNQN